MNAAERSRINRANGAQSRGPKTDATKAISARNSLKHGLRAQKHALPNEDPQEAQDEALRWLAHYRPRTEHQEELVERIASACTLQRRCQRAYTATVAQQVLNANADLDRAHETEVDAFRARLVKEPAAAVSGLRRTALGCRWLIGRWHELRRTLAEFGCFAVPHHEHLARLRGLNPEVDRPEDPELLALRTHFVFSLPQQRPHDIDWAFQGVTADVRPLYQSRWADPEANRVELRRRIDEAVAELSEREQRLRTGREAVERSTAADRALLIADPERARLWIRYSSESNSTYFRASRELQRSLAEDENGAEMFDEACSPNEPNDPGDPPLTDDIDESCGVNAAVISECEGAGRSARDPGGAGFQPAATTPIAQPAPAAVNGPSPNEPNDPSEVDLTEDSIDVYALKALIASSPLAAAIWERAQRLDRPELDLAERARLIGEQQRDLAEWDEEIRRRGKRVG